MYVLLFALHILYQSNITSIIHNNIVYSLLCLKLEQIIYVTLRYGFWVRYTPGDLKRCDNDYIFIFI